MARRSLKPQLNQIRAWVQQGRTDAWIAHQLEVSVSDLVSFKREHELAPPEAAGDNGDGGAGPIEPQEDDLRAQDEALVAAALDAEPDEEEDEGDGGEDPSEEGYGLWLDPAVQDDPVYAEHWAGHRPVTVAVERDQIVIRRAGEEAGSGDGNGDGDE